MINIVVIGGSCGGTNVTRQLEKKFKSSVDVVITVIEKQEEYSVPYAGSRAIVDFEFAKSTFISPAKFFPADSRHKYVVGEVVSITKNSATLASGVEYPFDYVIFATGAAYRLPFKMQISSKAAALEEFERASKLISAAQAIVIVGGGAVGIEVSSEIKAAYPTKDITLVAAPAHLMFGTAISENNKNRFKDALEANGIKVVLNERVKLDNIDQQRSCIEGDHVVKTESGKEFNSNLTILALGGTSSNSGYVKSFLESMLNERGEFKVKGTLQIDAPDCDHMFCIGDAAATGADKSVIPIYSQMGVITANIFGMMNKNTSSMKTFKGAKVPIFMLTLSKTQGLGQIPYMPNFLSDRLEVTMKAGVIIF